MNLSVILQKPIPVSLDNNCFKAVNDMSWGGVQFHKASKLYLAQNVICLADIDYQPKCVVAKQGFGWPSAKLCSAVKLTEQHALPHNFVKLAL